MSISVSEQWATVWELKRKDVGKNGHYVYAGRLSTSRKVKAYGDIPEGYANSSWFCEFVHTARDLVDGMGAPNMEKMRIKILSGAQRQEQYEKDGQKAYPKNPTLVVFDFEFAENKETKKAELPPEDDIPF
jgi:hypothetical protein